MAFRNVSVSLPANTATLLLAAQVGDVDAWVNIDPNETYYLGGPGVTVSNGLKLFANSTGTFHTQVLRDDELWAIAPNAVDVNVMVRSA
jgi:hypothetical protein